MKIKYRIIDNTQTEISLMKYIQTLDVALRVSIDMDEIINGDAKTEYDTPFWNVEDEFFVVCREEDYIDYIRGGLEAIGYRSEDFNHINNRFKNLIAVCICPSRKCICLVWQPLNYNVPALAVNSLFNASRLISKIKDLNEI